MPITTVVPGVTGIAGYTKGNPFADAAELQGSPVNPAHAQIGEQSEPYPWEAYGGAQGPPMGPFGIENELLSETPASIPAGNIHQDPEGDYTPYYGSHAAPFPKGYMRGKLSSVGPDSTSDKLEQNLEIQEAASGINAGASRNYSESLLAKQDTWVGFFNEVPGEDMLAIVPSQVSVANSGWGVNDHRSNSFAKVNEFGYEDSHRHRRYATGKIPGNSLWLRARGRPMVKTMPHPAILPVGTNSPFAGQDITETYGIDGAILQDDATAYVPPPTPYVAPAYQQTSDVPDVGSYL